MGLFHRVFGADKGDSIKVVAQGELQDLAEGAAFEVVGESFYTAEFRLIAKDLRAKAGDEVFVEVELRLEPNNKYSKSGKAVAVYALGLKVGHIPETSCAAVFDVIKPTGDAAICQGRIYFDDFSSSSPRHSVVIFIDFPPRFAGQPARSVAFGQLPLEKQDELHVKRQARIRGGGPTVPELKEGDLVCPENVRGFDLTVLEKILEPHGIRVSKSSSAALYIVDKPETWNSRVGLERLLKMDLPSVFYGDFFEKYPHLAPSEKLAEAIEAARAWMEANPDAYEAEKAIVNRVEREGRLLLRGHAVVSNRPIDGGVSQIASYPARVMKNHRDPLKKLLVDSGARVYDKLILVGDLRKDPETNRMYVSVGGVDVCAMYASERGYFDLMARYLDNPFKDVLEISWVGDEEISVNLNSFHFHY